MKLLTCLIWETVLLCTQWRKSGPHLASRGKSHGFSQVAAGTCGIFSSYGRDVHSKLEFLPRSQDTCLGMTNTSGIYTRLGRRTRTLLEVKREIRPPFLVGTVILGFLSIFKNSEPS